MRGVFCAIAGFASFSAGDVIAKTLGMQGYSAWQISCGYAFCALVGLLGFSAFLGGLKNTLRTKQRGLHFLRSLLSAPTQALNFYAFSHIPLANAYAVIFLAPFLTAAFAVPLLRERVSLAGWGGIFAGFAGVMMAVRPDLYGFSLPVLAVAVTALFTALRNIIVRAMKPGETPLSLALYPVCAVFLATLIPALQAYVPFKSETFFLIASGGALFGLGLLLTSLAFRYARAALVAPFHYSQIIWGLLFGIFMFGDTPDMWTMTGAVLIMGSGLYLIYGARKGKQ